MEDASGFERGNVAATSVYRFQCEHPVTELERWRDNYLTCCVTNEDVAAFGVNVALVFCDNADIKQ